MSGSSSQRRHTCAYHKEHDMVRDVPTGKACGAPATQEIYWKDGRVSPCCGKHGLRALDADTRQLVLRIKRPRKEEQWATVG